MQEKQMKNTNMQVVENNRWQYIDLIESIGILFVLIYHSTTYSFNWLDEFNPLYLIRYFLRTILSTCVPLFFFANGYLLFNHKFDLKRHIVKSIRIVILTFLWGLISILFLMPIENEFLSLKDMLAYLWTWHQGWINHLWYMGALICIYVFFPLLKVAFDSKREYFVYFTVLAAIFTFGNSFINIAGTIGMNFFRDLDHVLDFNWFNMFNPFKGIRGYAFVYFCIGGLMHDFKSRILLLKKSKRVLISVIAMLCSCVALFVLGIFLSKITGKTWDVVWDGYDTIPTFVNVIAIFVLSLSYEKNNAVIRSISCNTLGVYFIHEIFIHMMKDYVMNFTLFCTFIGCVGFAVIILGISLVFVFGIKKLPIINNKLKI